MSTSNLAIEALGLVKRFDGAVAADGVDLSVPEGAIYGILGPNGAGKTTTLRMLTTLLRPDAGTATVAGYDVVRESQQVRRSIGYVSQAGSTFSSARAGDEVMDHGMLYGLSRADALRRGQQLFDELQLEGLWTRMPAMVAPCRSRLSSMKATGV